MRGDNDFVPHFLLSQGNSTWLNSTRIGKKHYNFDTAVAFESKYFQTIMTGEGNHLAGPQVEGFEIAFPSNLVVEVKEADMIAKVVRYLDTPPA